jgi:hypothetical protein
MIVETAAAYRLRPEKPRNIKQNRLSNAVPLITLMGTSHRLPWSYLKDNWSYFERKLGERKLIQRLIF